MKCVMKLIEEYAQSEEVYEDDPGKRTKEYTTKIWEAIGDKYLQSKFSVNCTAEISWKTLYNKMAKAKAKAFNNEN